MKGYQTSKLHRPIFIEDNFILHPPHAEKLFIGESCVNTNPKKKKEDDIEIKVKETKKEYIYNSYMTTASNWNFDRLHGEEISMSYPYLKGTRLGELLGRKTKLGLHIIDKKHKCAITGIDQANHIDVWGPVTEPGFIFDWGGLYIKQRKRSYSNKLKELAMDPDIENIIDEDRKNMAPIYKEGGRIIPDNSENEPPIEIGLYTTSGTTTSDEIDYREIKPRFYRLLEIHHDPNDNKVWLFCSLLMLSAQFVFLGYPVRKPQVDPLSHSDSDYMIQCSALSLSLRLPLRGVV